MLATFWQIIGRSSRFKKFVVIKLVTLTRVSFLFVSENNFLMFGGEHQFSSPPPDHL